MKKMILGLIFLAQLTSAAQPVANQEILTTQKQSPRKRFTAWVQSQVDATAKDARTLYQYAQRMARSKQPIKPNEQELQALKNSGIKAGALLAAMGILHGGRKVWLQWKKADKSGQRNKALPVQPAQAPQVARPSVPVAAPQPAVPNAPAQPPMANPNEALFKAMTVAGIQRALAAGADVNYANDKGVTLLMRAAESDNIEIVNALLAARADVNRADLEGNTPLMFAAYYGDVAVVKALLAAGANVNKRDKSNMASLDRAIFKKNEEAVKALLAADANFDYRNGYGSTPFIIAVMMRSVGIAKILLEAGANVNMRDNEGKSALDIANAKNDEVMIGWLKKYGAR